MTFSKKIYEKLIKFCKNFVKIFFRNFENSLKKNVIFAR